METFKYSLSPDYIVRYWCRKNENIIGVEQEKKTTTIKEASKRNLNVGYKRGNDLSLTSKKEIIKRVKWINEIGEVKNYKTKKGDIIQYKSSMITLTLPIKTEVEPAEITKTALGNFITLMRKVSGVCAWLVAHLLLIGERYIEAKLLFEYSYVTFYIFLVCLVGYCVTRLF